MSDFLTNLAARALCPPTLAPRTRLRFEPPGPAIEDPPLPAASPPAEAAEPPAEPRRRPAARALEPAENAAPVEHARAAAAPASPTDPARATASEVEAEPVRARGPADSAEPAGPLPPAVQSPDLGDMQAGRVSGPKPSLVPIADVTVARVVRRGRVATPERAEADRVPRSDRPHRYDTQPPEVARAEPERPRPGHPVPPRELARATPRRPLRDHAPVSSRDGADGEHVVQVSIGRIEVRAVAPSAPPAAARRGGAMTIEEYLAKRRERR